MSVNEWRTALPPLWAVKSIVRRLRLGGSVASYVVADACHYKIPKDEMPDVILSEPMNAALEFEPQVAIMRHLLGQAPGARLVPESVQVDEELGPGAMLDHMREAHDEEVDCDESLNALFH